MNICLTMKFILFSPNYMLMGETEVFLTNYMEGVSNTLSKKPLTLMGGGLVKFLRVFIFKL